MLDKRLVLKKYGDRKEELGIRFLFAENMKGIKTV